MPDNVRSAGFDRHMESATEKKTPMSGIAGSEKLKRWCKRPPDPSRGGCWVNPTWCKAREVLYRCPRVPPGGRRWSPGASRGPRQMAA